MVKLGSGGLTHQQIDEFLQILNNGTSAWVHPLTSRVLLVRRIG